jgi:threonyl-tRNA synthetase
MVSSDKINKVISEDMVSPMARLQNEQQLYRLRHSCAHIMAQAVVERFESNSSSDVKLGVGPPIDGGFYYDFLLPRPVTDDDLIWIEKRMKEIIEDKVEFRQEDVSADEARKRFANQPFKLELIDLIASGKSDDNGEESSSNSDKNLNGASSSSPNMVSIFSHSNFEDLCKGPHVASSGEINPDGIKVLSVAGAYWRGSEKNPMLNRIYGTVWSSQKELQEYLQVREEAKRRDHRQIGKRLGLFHFDESAPGMPYWLPNGMKVLNELIGFWRQEHEQRDYMEISSPLVNDRKLYEISGHWEHYKDNMFLIPVEDGEKESDQFEKELRDPHREPRQQKMFGLKPMNCPNAMVVFNLELRSYRDLPMRLADCDVLHRHERSGTLHGLLRVQKFQQDDAHIFVSPEQIESEFDAIFELADKFYKIFNLDYSYRLSLRPEKFVGEEAVWDSAEASLKRILDSRVGEGNYLVAPGEGAFYGPKVDIMMRDSLGRKWQMGTIQLDFQLPARFGCQYVDRDGKRKVPAVIHRVIYGSLDRFIGILLEDTAGELPIWLAPVQVVIVPISASHAEYAGLVGSKLKENRIRNRVESASSWMQKYIRKAELEKVPYIVVVGDKEVDSQRVSVRFRHGSKNNDLSIDDFIAHVKRAIEQKLPSD